MLNPCLVYRLWSDTPFCGPFLACKWTVHRFFWRFLAFINYLEVCRFPGSTLLLRPSFHAVFVAAFRCSCGDSLYLPNKTHFFGWYTAVLLVTFTFQFGAFHWKYVCAVEWDWKYVCSGMGLEVCVRDVLELANLHFSRICDTSILFRRKLRGICGHWLKNNTCCKVFEEFKFRRGWS